MHLIADHMVRMFAVLIHGRDLRLAGLCSFSDGAGIAACVMSIPIEGNAVTDLE